MTIIEILLLCGWVITGISSLLYLQYQDDHYLSVYTIIFGIIIGAFAGFFGLIGLIITYFMAHGDTILDKINKIGCKRFFEKEHR